MTVAHERPDTHAGGIVYRDVGSGPEYLIVRARRDPSAWVLPKGHIERGETAEEAAVRDNRDSHFAQAPLPQPDGHAQRAGIALQHLFQTTGPPTLLG